MNLPPALPPHGSFLAWYRECHCEPCEATGQAFLRELYWRHRVAAWDDGSPRRVPCRWIPASRLTTIRARRPAARRDGRPMVPRENRGQGQFPP